MCRIGPHFSVFLNQFQAFVISFFSFGSLSGLFLAKLLDMSTLFLLFVNCMPLCGREVLLFSKIVHILIRVWWFLSKFCLYFNHQNRMFCLYFDFVYHKKFLVRNRCFWFRFVANCFVFGDNSLKFSKIFYHILNIFFFKLFYCSAIELFSLLIET